MKKSYAVLAVCGCLAVAVALVAYTAMAADQPANQQRTAVAGREAAPVQSAADPRAGLASSLKAHADSPNQALAHTGTTRWQPVTKPPEFDEKRVGGDTCATATVISALPYSDTGNTCGYVNDYDEVCPYTGSTAPDVAYEYYTPGDITVDITLCNGSAYDTKLYVYQDSCPGVLIDCNDDACPGYVSELLGVALTGGHTYYIIVDGYSTACGSYVIDVTEGVPPPPPPACPPDSLYGNLPDPPDASWSFATSSQTLGYLVAEDYSVTGDICDIHWWGLDLWWTGSGWAECDHISGVSQFQITFYQDAGGVPGAVACQQTVTATVTGTTLLYAGYEMKEYVALLVPCCTLQNGWVSIQSVNDTSCHLLWASGGAGNSLQHDGLVWGATGYERGLCLTGQYVPTWGACCDDSTGICIDDVEMIDCPPPLRFEADTLCADLDPACGSIPGACCYPDGSCTITTEADCIGGLWLGPYTTCDQCPCIVPCPPGATIEAEACGADTNGGCNMTVPQFEPIACDETICGKIWADGGTRDTDWYELVLTDQTEITFSVKAEFETLGVVCGIVETVPPGSGDCNDSTGYLNPYATGGECEEISITECLAPGTYWLFVSALDFYDLPCDGSNDYTATVECVPCTLPTGACCMPNGDCIPDLTEAECLQIDGDYQGDGTGCVPNPCPQPEPGDNCSLPVQVTLPADLPYADLAQYTCGRGYDYQDTCLGYYDGGEDIIYEVTVTDPVNVEVTMNPLGTTWTGIALDDECPPGDPCMAYATGSSGSTIKTLGCLYLAPGVYYIMVDTWPSPYCIPAFNLNIDVCTPPTGACCVGTDCVATVNEADCINIYGGDWYEDEDCATFICPTPTSETCEGAIVIDALPYGANFDNDDATPHGPDGTCDKYYPTQTGLMQNDVWFVWTADDSCENVIATATPEYYDVILVVRDNCTDLTELYCADEESSSGTETITFPVTPGTTYYFQMGDTGSYEYGGPTIFTLDCYFPPGACCLPTGECVILNEPDCLDQGGAFQGEGTDCSGGAAGAGMLYEADPNLAIPDGVGVFVSDTINVPDSFTLYDVNVDVVIDHTYVGDLIIEVEHNGERIRLWDNWCSYRDDMDVIFDDEGEDVVCDYPTVGYVIPFEALSVYDGMDAAGDWTIYIADVYYGDVGTLTHWSLHLADAPVPSPGACCLPGATCIVTTEECCEYAGGAFMGYGTDCGAFSYVVGTGGPWEDISTTGTQLFLGDDSGEFVTIDFNFNYWGDTHADVAVCSNGFLTFSPDDLTDLSEDPIPDDNLPNDLIAVLWDDLDPANTGSPATIHYQTLGNAPYRRFIAQWTDVPEYPNEGANTFQAVLFESTNCVELRYLEITTDDFVAGVENQDGTEGVDVSGSVAEGASIALCPSLSGNPCILYPFLDIKPGSCPNPFNRKSRGVTPMAVLGDAEVDATMVDVSTVSVARSDGVGGSVPALRGSDEDVGTPFLGELCDCHELGGDGVMDKTLKFKTQDMVDELQLGGVSGDLELVVSGLLTDDRFGFVAHDCIWFVPANNPVLLASHKVKVYASEWDALIDVSPLDNFADGEGYADFVRYYHDGLVTLTAPATLPDGRPFLYWEIDGVRQPDGQRSIVVDMLLPGGGVAISVNAVFDEVVSLQGRGW
jgi:subtilisin-like proprotein convertase family protein